jgi:hypothetical protein
MPELLASFTAPSALGSGKLAIPWLRMHFENASAWAVGEGAAGVFLGELPPHPVASRQAAITMIPGLSTQAVRISLGRVSRRSSCPCVISSPGLPCGRSLGL